MSNVNQNQPVSGEQWKDVKGYEGLYSVSDQGRVRSEITKDGNGNKLILIQQNRCGYCTVTLGKRGNRKILRVHQLVMKAFKDNPDPEKYTMINHINEDKSDNRVENLEWCDAKHNRNCGTVNERIRKTMRENSLLKKAVQCYDKETGSFIKEFPSASEAAREMNICISSICQCARGDSAFTKKGGKSYVWKYVKEDKN